MSGMLASFQGSYLTAVEKIGTGTEDNGIYLTISTPTEQGLASSSWLMTNKSLSVRSAVVAPATSLCTLTGALKSSRS